MVYNAMKLFMEVNPQLFDECTHDYTEQQSNVDNVKAARKAKWDRLQQLAESMKKEQRNGNGVAPAVRPPAASAYSSKSLSNKAEDTAATSDPLSRESQQRMERLRLQDDRDSTRERSRPERQSNSVR